MGLEPTTSEATTRCYHQLSYAHHIYCIVSCIVSTTETSL